MFNGKRSHSLIGVLATVCAFYITRLRRPSWPVLFATSFAGALVVAIAIGWRNNPNYEMSLSGFTQFSPTSSSPKILESLNIEDEESEQEDMTYETTEYGGFLLMMDTVPEKSDHDYGASYIRIFSTFIPRISGPASLSSAANSGSPPGSPARSWSGTRSSPARRSASWGRPSSTAAPWGP